MKRFLNTDSMTKIHSSLGTLQEVKAQTYIVYVLRSCICHWTRLLALAEQFWSYYSEIIPNRTFEICMAKKILIFLLICVKTWCPIAYAENVVATRFLPWWTSQLEKEVKAKEHSQNAGPHKSVRGPLLESLLIFSHVVRHQCS